MASPKPRYIPTRVIGDPKVAKRYRRSGWIVFDTAHPIASHLFVNTKAEAQSICNSRNATQNTNDESR
jgi:hypothetical protein